jgi:hypothetical protein
MSVQDDYLAEYGDDYDYLRELRSKTEFVPDKQVERAIDLWKGFKRAFDDYEAYLNRKKGSQRLLVAAAVYQIIDSLERGIWTKADNPAMPTLAEALDEIQRLEGIPGLFAPHNGWQLVQDVLEEFKRKKQDMEDRANDLIGHLESLPFLLEFNNAPDIEGLVFPCYSPLDQLYLANLFALHLHQTTAGIELFKRSPRLELRIPSEISISRPEHEMPVFHPSRFTVHFRLDQDLTDTSKDGYDPQTRTYKVDTLGLLKTLGDGTVGGVSRLPGPGRCRPVGGGPAF